MTQRIVTLSANTVSWAMSWMTFQSYILNWAKRLKHLIPYSIFNLLCGSVYSWFHYWVDSSYNMYIAIVHDNHDYENVTSKAVQNVVLNSGITFFAWLKIQLTSDACDSLTILRYLNTCTATDKILILR